MIRRTTLVAPLAPVLTLALVAACGSSSAPGDATGDDAHGGNDAAASSGSSSGSSGSGSGSGSSSGGTSGAASGSGSGDSGVSGVPEGGSSGSEGDANPGTILDPDGGTCPAPAGIDSNTAGALMLVNDTRAAMGVPCATMVPALNTSAADHCMYYAANQKTDAGCVADPHTEVQGCADYVAAQFGNREKAAGYTGQPSFEVMAFSDNGPSAVQQWIDSVWHRTPVLSPWTRDLGYGAATKCDTIDFGVGAAAPSNLIATYPYEGQTGVPLSFNGNYEGPEPPTPPSGWPSGYPVTVYAKGATITTHEFSVDGGPLLDHQWITTATSMGLLPNAVLLYGNAPLTTKTKYRVHVAGTLAGGGTIDVNVTFTTK